MCGAQAQGGLGAAAQASPPGGGSVGWEGGGNGSNVVDAYRVWEVKASREVRLRLRQLYVRLSSAVRQACKSLKERHSDAFREKPERFSEKLIGEASKTAGLPKGLFCYAGEWYRMVRKSRRKSRLRSRFTPPPVPLLIRVVSNSERLHGNTAAVAVLNAFRGELRIPCAGIAVRLRPSLVRAVLEDLERFKDVKLTLQLSARGRLRLIAHRKVKQVWWDGNSKLAVVALDVNSGHGLYMIAFTFDSEARLLTQRVFKPPNTTMLRLLAAIMTSYSELGCWGEAVERFRERRDVRRLQREGRGYAAEEALRLAERLRAELNLTPERAQRVAGQASRKVKKVNEYWVRATLKELRVLVRKLRDQGYTAVIVADVPQAETLKGSQLQRTLLRAAKRLENLATYEGARWFDPENNVSGKRCPVCGAWGVELGKRYYRCTKCDVTYGGDWAACANAAKLFLKACDAKKQLEALRSWLRTSRALVHGAPKPAR